MLYLWPACAVPRLVTLVSAYWFWFGNSHECGYEVISKKQMMQDINLLFICKPIGHSFFAQNDGFLTRLTNQPTD